MRRYWVRALAIGADGAALLAAVMTYRDWRLNPGGIFHDAQGTHWRIVGETALTWFAPAWVVLSAAALVVFWWIARRR